MWHDVLPIAVGAPSTSNDSILTALVTVGLPALGTIVGLLITRSKPKDKEALPPPPPPAALNTDAADEEEDALRRRIAVLERFCFRNHIDPTKVRRGTETIADVSFD